MALGSGASGTSRGGGVDSGGDRNLRPGVPGVRSVPDSVLNDSSDRPLELAEDLADAARSSDGVDEQIRGRTSRCARLSRPPRRERNGEGAETNHLARFPSVASLGTPRLTRPQPHARRPFAAPTQTDDERDEDESDEEEDEVECADDASGSGAFANASRDEKQPTTRSFAAFAPSTSPHPYLPGVLPGRPRAAWTPVPRRAASERDARWLRAHPPRRPRSRRRRPAAAPAVFGVPTFPRRDRETRGFSPCPESEKMWVRFGGSRTTPSRRRSRPRGSGPAEAKAKRNAASTENETASAEPGAGVARAPPGVFNVAWNGALRKGDFERLNEHQRVNHFPGTWELGRKDKLGANLEKARRRHPDAFDFAPRSFLLPRDTEEWRKDRARLGPRETYIIKPPASRAGAACACYARATERLTRRDDASDASGRKRSDASDTSRKTLVQRYIRDPHLLDGYKYDLRVYVALTSVDPLRVFLYREGLVRLATEKYADGGADLSRRCMHLTNYSVNVKNAGFTMVRTRWGGRNRVQAQPHVFAASVRIGRGGFQKGVGSNQRNRREDARVRGGPDERRRRDARSGRGAARVL